MKQIAGTNQTVDGLYGASTGRLEAQASRKYIYDGADDVKRVGNGNQSTMIAFDWGCTESNPILPLGFSNQ
jgi:hypothetical protein